MKQKRISLEYDNLLSKLGVRKTPRTKGDYLFNYFQYLKILDENYEKLYKGMADAKNRIRENPNDTKEEEKEISDLMKQLVLLVRFRRKQLQSSINEIVPKTFIIDIEPLHSSDDFDCSDAGALASAICATSFFWGPEFCIIAGIIAAVHCGG